MRMGAVCGTSKQCPSFGARIAKIEHQEKTWWTYLSIEEQVHEEHKPWTERLIPFHRLIKDHGLCRVLNDDQPTEHEFMHVLARHNASFLVPAASADTDEDATRYSSDDELGRHLSEYSVPHTAVSSCFVMD